MKRYHGYKKPSTLDNMPKRTLARIRKEFVALVKGFEVSVDVNVKYSGKVKTRVVWLSDLNAEHSDTYDQEEEIADQCVEQIYPQIQKKLTPALTKHTKAIRAFCKRTDKEADKYNVVRDDLWDYLVGEV